MRRGVLSALITMSVIADRPALFGRGGNHPVSVRMADWRLPAVVTTTANRRLRRIRTDTGRTPPDAPRVGS